MIDSVITAAPTTPIGAARMVPITMTATASAPGHRLSSTSVALSMSLAEPDRSRIAPMKMNIGIDASTGSAATPAHIRNTTSEMPMRWKTPSEAPTRANSSDSPPMTKATGYPTKMKKNMLTNMINARLSVSLSITSASPGLD